MELYFSLSKNWTVTFFERFSEYFFPFLFQSIGYLTLVETIEFELYFFILLFEEIKKKGAKKSDQILMDSSVAYVHEHAYVYMYIQTIIVRTCVAMCKC